MISTTTAVLEWGVWAVSLLVGLCFAFGIRQTAVNRIAPPMWPTLINSLSLVALPLAFLFLPFSKLHIVWLLIIVRPLSFIAGVGYVPLLSQILIWPAYLYAAALMLGTGVRLSSPSKQSPWAARAGHGSGLPFRYAVRGFFQGLWQKRSPQEEAHIARIMESRSRRGGAGPPPLPAEEPAPLDEDTYLATISFTCPRCGTMIEAPSDMAGEEAECPNDGCGSPVRVPG